MTWVKKKASDLKGGDTVRLDDEDVAVLEMAPRPLTLLGEDLLIAWVIGDKLPVYFEVDEEVEVSQ